MGDAFITTNNPILLKNTKKLRTVMCEQKSATKQVINDNLLKKANKNGFGNDVGLVTNRCTSMFDVLAKFEKGSKEYDELMYRITCCQAYQQEVIDSCKGIIPKQMPKSWYESKGADDYEDDLVANKKPYFFIYNYKHIKTKYTNYIKNCNDKCKIRFGIDLETLMSKKDKTEDEIDFLYWFDKLNPVSDNGGAMNRICHMLEDEFEGLKYHISKSEFDKHILMTNKSIKKSLIKDVLNVYEEYKNETYAYVNGGNQSDDKTQFEEKYKEKIFAICNNEEDLANILVSELYDTSNSKHFIWAMCGEYLVNKLLKDNDYKIKYPIEDENGDIEWNGTRYSITEERIDEDC